MLVFMKWPTKPAPVVILTFSGLYGNQLALPQNRLLTGLHWSLSWIHDGSSTTWATPRSRTRCATRRCRRSRSRTSGAIRSSWVPFYGQSTCPISEEVDAPGLLPRNAVVLLFLDLFRLLWR